MREETLTGTWTKTAETVYVGGLDIERTFVGGALDNEIETLHLSDADRRIALIETLTIDGGDAVTTPTPKWRYQHDNHLRSACVETSDDGTVISYEEYLPFGLTSYAAHDSTLEARAKRYRYSGKERDEETGLYYYGARYLAPWMGRWTSADPAGTVDGLNLYAFVRGAPSRGWDADGREAQKQSVSPLSREDGNPIYQALSRDAVSYIVVDPLTGSPVGDRGPMHPLPESIYGSDMVRRPHVELTAENHYLALVAEWDFELRPTSPAYGLDIDFPRYSELVGAEEWERLSHFAASHAGKPAAIVGEIVQSIDRYLDHATGNQLDEDGNPIYEGVPLYSESHYFNAPNEARDAVFPWAGQSSQTFTTGCDATSWALHTALQDLGLRSQMMLYSSVNSQGVRKSVATHTGVNVPGVGALVHGDLISQRPRNEVLEPSEYIRRFFVPSELVESGVRTMLGIKLARRVAW